MKTKVFAFLFVTLSIMAISCSKDDTEKEIPVSNIIVEPQSITIIEGETAILTTTITPEEATDKTITWISSAENVATVDDNGVITAKSVGETTITATTHNDKTATCIVTVEKAPIPVSDISLDKTSATIKIGEIVELIASITPEEATDKTITWISSAENVATVDDNGVITAKSVGETTITATTHNDKTATCIVTVTPLLIQIGEEVSKNNSWYFPFYTLFKHCISEQMFSADELQSEGMISAPLTSISWYAFTIPSPNKEHDKISIWMANVDDVVLTNNSHITSDMTLVFEGSLTPVIGWNEFVLNKSGFAWDGKSDLLICIQRNTGDITSSMRWATHFASFNATQFTYKDDGPFDMKTTSYYTYNPRNERANILFKYE